MTRNNKESRPLSSCPELLLFASRPSHRTLTIALGSEWVWMPYDTRFAFGFDDDLLVRPTSVFGAGQLDSTDPVFVGRGEKHIIVRTGPWTFWLPVDTDGRFPRGDDIVPRVASTDATVELHPSRLSLVVRQCRMNYPGRRLVVLASHPLMTMLPTATGRPLRHKGRQPYSLLTANGRVRLLRIRWHCPEVGCDTRLDQIVDVVEQTISQGVREMARRLNRGATSFRVTAENLGRAAHLDVSHETLRQLVQSDGSS